MRSDGNIRYFEFENGKFEYLSEYKSADPQRGIAFLPKRGVDLHDNEVTRAYKTVADSYIEPISFIVPRRSEVFQSDIYPPTVGLKPSVSGKEWLGGKSGLPPKISLEDVYEGQEPQEVKSDYKPPTIAVSSPPPAKAAAEPPKPAPASSPIASRGPPPTVNDNKASLGSAASKFADKDEEEESSDDDSSFEEVSKPVERPSAAVRQQEKVSSPAITQTPATKQESAPERAFKSSAAPTSSTSAAAPTPAPSAPAAASAPSTGGPAEGIRSFLHDIKAALEQQTKLLHAQSEQISHLTAEVDTLKTRLGSQQGGREKDERIRQLELELEEARSQLED